MVANVTADLENDYNYRHYNNTNKSPSRTSSDDSNTVVDAVCTVIPSQYSSTDVVPPPPSGGTLPRVISEDGLVVLPKRDDDEKRRSKRKLIIIIFVVLSVVVVVVGLTAGIVVNKNNDKSSDNNSSLSSSPVANGGSVLEETMIELTSEQYQERFLQTRTALVVYANVDPTSFVSPSTPQSEALTWLVYKDQVLLRHVQEYGFSGGNDSDSDQEYISRLIQRYAVMVLYYACSGSDWPGFPTPLEDEIFKSECNFTGFECNALNEIEVLELPDQNLAGYLPSEIGLLTQLFYLDLSNNKLRGPLPETLYDLTNLEFLDFEFNSFSSTLSSAVGELKSLKVLRINNNLFEGPLPSIMGNLNLTGIDLSFNAFTGNVMDYFETWHYLDSFRIERTSLTGTFPKAIEDYPPLLEGLDITEVRLSGPIPTALVTQLTNLKHLAIGMEFATGTIPREIGRLSNLEYFAIRKSPITGPLPRSIGNLTKLEHFAIDYTHMTGTIPNEVGFLSNLKKISFESNRFTGVLTSSIANWTQLDKAVLSEVGVVGNLDSICYVREVVYDCGFECTCCKQDCTNRGTPNQNYLKRP